MNTIKRIFASDIMIAIIYIVIGGLLIFRPEVSYTVVCYVIAALIAVFGIINIIKYMVSDVAEGRLNNYLSIGLCMLVVAFLLLLRQKEIEGLIPTLLGLAIAVDGVIKLQRSVDLARLKFEGWIFVLILALLCLALGVVLILRPIDAAKTLILVLGIGLVFCGLTGLVVGIFVKAKLRTLRKETKKAKKEEGEAKEPAAAEQAAAPHPANALPSEYNFDPDTGEPIRKEAAEAEKAADQNEIPFIEADKPEG